MRWYSTGVGVGLIVALSGLPGMAADEKAESLVVAKLPTFAKGKYKGKHAVYQTPTFEAVMDDTSTLWIQPWTAVARRSVSPSSATTCALTTCRRTASSATAVSPASRTRHNRVNSPNVSTSKAS